MSSPRGEGLDDDKLGGAYPPEQPLGADAYGTTAAEERTGEPLTERVSREEPEPEPVNAPEEDSARLVAPDEGVHTDVDSEAVARADTGGPGPLSDDDPLAGDPDTRDVATELEGPAPAEEAAVHVSDEDDV